MNCVQPMFDAACGQQDSRLQNIGKLFSSRATRFQAQHQLRRILIWVLISELRMSPIDGILQVDT